MKRPGSLSTRDRTSPSVRTPAIRTTARRSESASPIREGDLLLLDVWGKTKAAGSVYYDITWVGYLGAKVPEKMTKIFGIVREARDKAVELIQSSVAAGKPLQGWQVDKAARKVIEKAGYGKYFFHRTGHNIGQTVHGNGVNMDGLETHDVRHLIPKTCNSIEPGIYLPEFGIRSEVNVYIGRKRSARNRSGAERDFGVAGLAKAGSPTRKQEEKCRRNSGGHNSGPKIPRRISRQLLASAGE